MDDRRRKDDQPDEAVFAPVPLSARGRPPIILAGVALAIVAAVSAATLEGVGGDPSIPAGVVPAVTAVTAPQALAARTELPTRSSRPPRPAQPTVTPELIRLDLRPSGRHLFVHGDVFSMDAFIVVVSLEERGVVTETRTVSMPGGSTAFLTDANPRFQARFDMPQEARVGFLWVRANAYDSHGDLILSLREPVLRAAR